MTYTTQDPYLLIEGTMSDWMKESILSKVSQHYPRLDGAKVADVLGILMDHDEFVGPMERWDGYEKFRGDFPSVPGEVIVAAFYAAILYLQRPDQLNPDSRLVNDFVEERLRRLPRPPKPSYTRREVMLVGGNEVEKPSIWVSNAENLCIGMSQVGEEGGFTVVEVRSTPHQLLGVCSAIIDVLRGVDEQ